MLLAELINYVVQFDGECTDCASSAFTAIGAAYATEGYYLQSDIIYQILYTDFGLFAPMLYILAAFGGLIGVATGAPPRVYMWFFMGPAIYSWLIDNTHQTHGVEWRIAGNLQDQRQVWKLSEAGLSNINHAYYDTFLAYSNQQPSEPAHVSTIFLWFDELTSSVAQWMVAWTGIHYQGGRGGTDTNLAVRNGPDAEGKHYLLSNLKWGLVENITDARLHNVDVRDAFVTFMASECGDRFGEVLDQASVIAAQNTRGENLRTEMSIFVKNGATPNHDLVTTNLGYQYVPTPQSLQRMISGPQAGAAQADGSLLQFLGGAFGGAANPTLGESISCQQYLALLTQAFRWEAGHIYHQLVSNVPSGLTPADIVYNLFYGWDIKIGRTPPDHNGQGGSAGQTMDQAEAYSFLNDLVLVHLYRNEMAIAPQAVDARFAAATKAENFAKAYARTTGNRAKYAEVYTWALMIPHVQGVLMFLLAAGYPFAALMIVIPGMHRAVLTWAKFWLWVKMWDVGFAIVMVLERSVWAMLGNGSNFSRTSDLITQMQTWGKVIVGCPGSQGSQTSCPIPIVVSSDGISYTPVWTGFGFIQVPTGSTPQTWENMLNTLDRAMILAANLDLDLSNSYYIYIMSALYFAVPAVTGQVILGAQAGAASLATQALGGAAQEIGKSAGSSMGSETVTAMHNNMASASQAAHAKSLRTSGFGAQAIEYGNQGMREEMAGSALSTANTALGRYKDNRAMENQSFKSASGALTGNLTGISKMPNFKDGAQSTGGGALDMGGASSAAQQAFSNGQVAATGAETGGSGGVGSGGRDGGDPAGIPGAGVNAPKSAAPGASPSGGPGAAAGGNGPRRVGGPSLTDRAKEAWNGDARKQAGNISEMAAAAGINKNTQQMLGDMSNINGMAAGMDVAGFRHSAAGKGYHAAAQRAGGYANFKAESDAWNARNSFSAQLSGGAVALGHFVGGMSAGNKPTAPAESMAMGGMLGSAAKQSAEYVLPTSRGGYFDSAQSTGDRLDSGFGQARVQGAYYAWTPAQSGAYSAKAETQMLGWNVHGGGRDGNQIARDTKGGAAATGSAADLGRGSSAASGALGMFGVGDGRIAGNDRSSTPNPGNGGVADFVTNGIK